MKQHYFYNFLLTGFTFMCLFSCSKKPIPVPESEKIFPDTAYINTSSPQSLTFDSITIIKCAGPAIFGEYPDLSFVFYKPNCVTCFQTHTQVVTDVTSSMLPITIAPSVPIVFYKTDDEFYCEETFIKIINHAPPVTGCSVPPQYVVGEIKVAENASNFSSYDKPDESEFYLEGLVRAGATSFTYKSNALVIRFHFTVS